MSVAAAEPPQASIEPAASSIASASTSTPDVVKDAKDEEDAERAILRAQCVAAFRSGASYREVAEQLRLTVATVQSHVRQARRLGELGEDAPARPKGRPRLINDAVDAMLARIIQEKGTRSARVIQEELAKPPHSTQLSYEVVRRRVKQLIDSIAALPPRQHDSGGQGEGNGEGRGQEAGSGSLREVDQVARDLDMLAETVRSIVTNATQMMDGDDGSDGQVGEDGGDADGRADNSLDVSGDAGGGDPEDALQASTDIQTSSSEVSGGEQCASSNLAAPTRSEDAGADDEEQTANGEPRRRSGRPRALTADMDETIAGELETDPSTTTRAIHASLVAQHPNLEVSFETVRRRVHAIRAQRGLSSSADAGEQNILAVEAEQDELTPVTASEAAATVKPPPASPTTPPPPSSTRKVKKGEYSPHTRALCVEKHEVGGMSYASIAKELGIPQDSVRAIIRKAKRTGSVQSAPRSGRPRKTSEIVDRVILQAVRANERSSAKAIQENLLKVFNVKVSSETIRRRVLANTRQRLLAISSGDDGSTYTASMRPLEDDAAAAAVASAMAGQESDQQAAAASTSHQLVGASSEPVASPTGALVAASSGLESESVVPRAEPAPPASPTRMAGEKRHLETSETSSPSMQPTTSDTAALSAGPATTDPEQQFQPPQLKKKRAKRREYSVELREKCVAMHEQGEGYRRIGQALDMPHTTVRAIVEKVTRTGSVLPAPRSGRPRKTDEIVDRVILEAVRANEKCSARMIQEELQRGFGVRISCETIRRRVKDHSRQSLARGVSPSRLDGEMASVSTAQPMSALPGFLAQPQQLAAVHEDPMLQLLPAQSVADDGGSVVL